MCLLECVTPYPTADILRSLFVYPEFLKHGLSTVSRLPKLKLIANAIWQNLRSSGSQERGDSFLRVIQQRGFTRVYQNATPSLNRHAEHHNKNDLDSPLINIKTLLPYSTQWWNLLCDARRAEWSDRRSGEVNPASIPAIKTTHSSTTNES
ncbi:hypothetical protein FRC03_012481 [Tulasnella sp. 419]|nr:hypothetical protein FRC03_012481 [Tulasnella sp. 419]